LREGHDTVPDAAVTAVIRMEIFEMLAGSECAVVEPKLLTLEIMKFLSIGWLICQSPAHRPVSRVFTIIPPLFIIVEHSPEKPPRVPAQ